MKSLWNDEDARQYGDDLLGLRVYSSRLLGADASLVMHGGGNTSVKIDERDAFGEPRSMLYVKGSGWDLETIEKPGFAPVQLDHLQRLASLSALSDPDMVNELKTHISLASAPTPSVEAILHAILPHRFVDHTHADAVVTLTNTPHGRDYIEEIYGRDVVVVPYVMPGFDLARVCHAAFKEQAHAGTQGMVLMSHGIFSFADDAKTSYERMIALVDRAECFLRQHQAWDMPQPDATEAAVDLTALPALRKAWSQQVGSALIIRRDDGAQVRRFIQRADLATVSQQGPATPDHVIRTKRLPMLGEDLVAYADAYQTYFVEQSSRCPGLSMLDPAPRVALHPEYGMLCAGKSVKDANIVRDIYQHTMDIIDRAERLDAWQALPAADIFAVEYWDLEQAKLRLGGKPAAFAGEVVLITGAASGIGKACVDAFLAQGAAVVGVDRDPNICGLWSVPQFLGLCADLEDLASLPDVIPPIINAFGGLDMLVLNAGIFSAAERIEALDLATWQRVMRINLDANQQLMSLAHPLLKQAPNGGRVVVMGSKNVPAPGPGAAAYSASKAALTQLARVAALEWGQDHIRINTLHPNAVFDTALWTDAVLAQRAEHYGMSVDDYKSNNLLRSEVRSADVAALAVAMCGPLFAHTTGAQLPVDGGNERVV